MMGLGGRRAGSRTFTLACNHTSMQSSWILHVCFRLRLPTAAVRAATQSPETFPHHRCLNAVVPSGLNPVAYLLVMVAAAAVVAATAAVPTLPLQLQLEEETYDSLDVFTFLGEPDHPNRPYPHFSKLAEAYGVPGLTAWTKQELLEGLGVMFSQPGPFLLEVVALAERPHIRYASGRTAAERAAAASCGLQLLNTQALQTCSERALAAGTPKIKSQPQ